ncbi:SUKH-4 family immunity protein [Streptomyces sp. OF3]|uniref:SUKH-4 family immunity protein n=1 Tax=Streptomyces alkaliterrae TaxID=2213162 RepID=A0A7W3WK47_9ACTN|nr:SUKH-4 family immunity protein [Streptomyces alkaliterrae]
MVRFLRERMSVEDGGPWSVNGVLGRYTSRTLAGHAVRAGTLEELLRDGRALAEVDPNALAHALAVAWPRGVPQGGLPADVHYLERLGVTGTPQNEWVAWLQHAAVTRGDLELAEALNESRVVPLWRTVWSRCRPYGSFGGLRTAEGLVPGPLPDGVEPSDLLDSDSWPLPDPGPPIRDIHGSLPGFDQRPLGGDRWLVTGPPGVFAVESAPVQRDESALSELPEPYPVPITRAAPWTCPAEAFAVGGPSRHWLEGTFGPGSCRRLAPDRLPDALVHEKGRDLLTDVGLPALHRHLPWLTTLDLASEPLQQEGSRFAIGVWTGGAIWLDGDTGALHLDPRSGYSDDLLTGSLNTLLVLLRLYHEFLISDFTTEHEREDARRSLVGWAEEIEPATVEADAWRQALAGDLDG